MNTVWSVKQAKEITGGISDPSKMPGHSFSTPASRCITGGKLRDIPGSVCEVCYALKGNYTRFHVVDKALEKRYQLLGHPQWVDAMVLLIEKTGDSYFRWHDAGDIQSMQHLRNIFAVCQRTPQVKYWLPTRETQFVKQISPGDVPDNLVIRMSSHMIDQGPVNWWPHTSTVASDHSQTCPAPSQGNKCQDCRACWDKSVKTVSYSAH
jgi:hypothetical protein